MLPTWAPAHSLGIAFVAPRILSAGFSFGALPNCERHDRCGLAPCMKGSEHPYEVDVPVRRSSVHRRLAIIMAVLSTAQVLLPAMHAGARTLSQQGPQLSLDTACRMSDTREFRRVGQDLSIKQAFASSEMTSTGSQVWEGSTVLTTFMESELGARGFEGKTVLELGAGTGLASICAALLGAKAVVVTDGSADVVALAEENAKRNLAPSVLSRMQFAPLQWQDNVGSRFDAVTGGRGFDVILASDVTYDMAVIPVLIELIRALSAPSGVILLSHTRRSKKISLGGFSEAFDVEAAAALPRGVTTCREGFLETVVLKMTPARPRLHSSARS